MISAILGSFWPLAAAAFLAGFAMSQVFFAGRKKLEAQGRKIDRLRSELAAADHSLMIRADKINELETQLREIDEITRAASRRVG